MTDTFSFHPPVLNRFPDSSVVAYSQSRPSSSSASEQQHQRGEPGGQFRFTASNSGPPPIAYGAATHGNLSDEDDPERAHTAHGPSTPTLDSVANAAATANARRLSFGEPGSPTSSPPYHPFSHSVPSAFQPTYYLNNGVNMRNTRPMTAPSSVSAPYFQGAMYSPGAPPVSSSFYAPAAYHQIRPQSIFQQQVDSASHLEEPYRARNFSLPELVDSGDGAAGDDKGPYSADSSPTGFLYGPPRMTPISVGAAPPSAFQNVPSTDPHERLSRPTTADARRPPPFGVHLPPPGSGAAYVVADVYGGASAATAVAAPPSQAPQTGAQQSSQGRSGDTKVYNFIAQAGQTTKRPRRRYDEIERLYNCDYPGCTKAYGTLNHLNSHKTMQKHGPKSTPAEFKDRRKAWREQKKQQAAAAAAAAAADRIAAPTANGPIRPIPERPRPSTSAGEYHYNLPAPFMSAVGTPVPSYPAQPTLSSQTAYSLEAQAAAHPPNWYTGPAYEGQTAPGYHAVRPLTAPSYYSNVAPGFGLGSINGGAGGALHLPPPGLVGAYGSAAGIVGERRMSLPGSQFGYQHDERFPSITEEYDVHSSRMTDVEKVDS